MKSIQCRDNTRLMVMLRRLAHASMEVSMSQVEAADQGMCAWQWGVYFPSMHVKHGTSHGRLPAPHVRCRWVHLPSIDRFGNDEIGAERLSLLSTEVEWYHVFETSTWTEAVLGTGTQNVKGPLPPGAQKGRELMKHQDRTSSWGLLRAGNKEETYGRLAETGMDAKRGSEEGCGSH
jgi:hypothetical protein